MPTELLMQAGVNGLERAGIYILVALGLTLVLSIMNIVNFAHGHFYMLGAFAIYYFYAQFHINYVVALVLAVLTVGVFGIILEKLTFSRVRGQLLQGLIVAIALVWLIEKAAHLIFGPDEKGVAPPIAGTIDFAGAVISKEKLVVVGACILLTLGLYALIFWTKMGRSIRAVAEDREAALMQGISVGRVSALAFGLGCALAAAGGGLVAPIYFVSPFIGMEPLLKGLAVIVMGGMGSITGVVAGGLLLGFIESFGLTFLGYAANLIAFVFIIFILLVRPQGFFGRPE